MQKRPLRLLFPHPALLSSSYFEGGIKAIRAMIARIRSDGHDCEMVTVPTTDDPLEVTWNRLGWDALFSGPLGDDPGRIAFALTKVLPVESLRESRGTLLRRVADYAKLRLEFGRVLRARVREGNHDWVIWDSGIGAFDLAFAAARRKLVLFVQSTMMLPFGPLRNSPLWEMRPKAAYRFAEKVIVPSRFLQGYLRTHAGVDSHVTPLVAYGRGPYPNLASPRPGFVTMVNPTMLKGVSIFIELAKSFPDQKFRAICGWGVPPAELARLPNVEFASPSLDLNAALADTKVLVVPSMWGEVWGMIAIDAMVRGIPVLASTDGGLPEATLGLGPTLPVRTVALDRGLRGTTFRALPQDVGPWREALADLLTDPAHYEERSQRAREAANHHVSSLSLDGLYAYLDPNASPKEHAPS